MFSLTQGGFVVNWHWIHCRLYANVFVPYLVRNPDIFSHGKTVMSLWWKYQIIQCMSECCMLWYFNSKGVDEPFLREVVVGA